MRTAATFGILTIACLLTTLGTGCGDDEGGGDDGGDGASGGDDGSGDGNTSGDSGGDDGSGTGGGGTGTAGTDDGSDGGTATGDGDTGTGDGGSDSGPGPECAGCVMGNCMTELGACFADPACACFSPCLASMDEDACLAECMLEEPPESYGPLEECTTDNCETECGA